MNLMKLSSLFSLIVFYRNFHTFIEIVLQQFKKHCLNWPNNILKVLLKRTMFISINRYISKFQLIFGRTYRNFYKKKLCTSVWNVVFCPNSQCIFRLIYFYQNVNPIFKDFFIVIFIKISLHHCKKHCLK